MQNITDWAALWRELVDINTRRFKSNGKTDDHWQTKARQYNEGVKERWSQPDSSRDFFHTQFKPGSSLLDIGAGTGAWSIMAAPVASKVTAVEPSPSMLEVLYENLSASNVHNVDVIEGSWPEVKVEMHDFSLSSHSMYGCRDLPYFIQCMIEATRNTCILIMRVPVKGSVIEEACRHIWGHSLDSPNFIIAYNILLEMGIHANVLMENSGRWKRWAHDSLEEALADVKSRFGLMDNDEYDAYLLDLFKRRLTYEDGRYVWSPGARSALIYWDV